MRNRFRTPEDCTRDESSRSTNKATSITKYIPDTQLIIREMKSSDKYAMFRLIADFRRDYYIGVFKSTFRSWFTYGITGILLAFSLSFLSSSSLSVFLPPLIVAFFLLYKVTKYKRLNRLMNVNDMEMLMNESDQRRLNQGVYLVFYANKNRDGELLDLEDIDLDTESSSELNESPTDESSTELSENASASLKELKKNKPKSFSKSKLSAKQKPPLRRQAHQQPSHELIGYAVYMKQRDELETVGIKELCIKSDYRDRHVATNLLRYMCKNVFKSMRYTRVTFQVSNFHKTAIEICKKKCASGTLKSLYSWCAYSFVPSVYDERTVFSFDMASLK
jgi:ribosomal protein S18 acetylase RimI-like enzyme